MIARLRPALFALWASWALPADLLAQQQFRVAPRASYILFDNSSALDDAAMLGVDATYPVGSSGLGVGIFLDFARPETLGEYFTPIRLDFGPESELRFVGVRTTLIQFGAQATYRIGSLRGRATPFAAGGLGGHVIYLDNQQQDGFDRVTGFNANFGGGVEIRVGETTGFRFEARDFVYFDWDREELNVVDPSLRDDRFPEQHGNPPPPKDVIHNLRFSVSFVFTPSSR